MLLWGCGDTPGAREKEDFELGTSAPPGRCEGSTPILREDGTASGYEICHDGAVHRVADLPNTAEVRELMCLGTEGDGSACTEDADCASTPLGRCIHGVHQPTDACYCVYTCSTDADCGEGQACVPDGILEYTLRGSICVSATCRIDADCPSGECGVTAWDSGCAYVVQLSCRDPEVDLCHGDANCDGAQQCVPWDNGDHYECKGRECDWE